MATNIAQLRQSNPEEYNKRIQAEAAKIRGTIGMPPAPQQSVPAPMNTPVAPTSYGTPTAPNTGVPTPPNMSGFNSTVPSMGMPPQSTPVPAPSPAPTQTGTSTSRQLSPEQLQIFQSLPQEAKHNYLMGISGTPSAPSTGVPTPQNSNGYPTLSPDQIRSEVAAKIAAETARRATAAGQAKTGIQTSYERLRTNVGQDRVLQDLTASRNSNPHSGRTSYDKGITNMERERTDREQSEDLQTRLANIDVSLQDYLNSTPEQQRSMENELIRQERSYAQQVEQFGYQKQRDATGDTRYANETEYNRGQDQITNDRNAANDRLVLRQQHIAEAVALSERYGIVVEPKDDYQLMLDQVAGLPTVSQQTAAQKQQSEQRSEAWKAVEMLGNVPSYLADILGVPPGTPTQRAKEAAMDAAYKERSANIDQQNANTSARNAETSAKNAQTAADKANAPEAVKAPTLDSVSKYANGIARYEYGELANPDQVEAAILSYDLPESEYRKLYATYGLKWGG